MSMSLSHPSNSSHVLLMEAVSLGMLSKKFPKLLITDVRDWCSCNEESELVRHSALFQD